VQPVLRENDPGFWGFVWQGAQYEGLVTAFLEFAGSEGGFVREDGRIRLDLPANREALAFMRDLIWRYRVSPPSTYTEMREEEVRLAFQQGDALFERNWPYAWRLHQQPGSPVALKVGIAPPPAPEGGRAVSTLGGWHIAVSRFSDRKREALEFLRFVTSRQGQRRLVLALGWNPGRQDLYEEPEILERMPYLRELKEVFRHARSRPVLPYYTQVSEIAQRHLNGALAGRDEPGEALRRAEAEIADLLARYRIE
jgi:multiple sugar transport system substrate-binding protein